MPPLSDALRDPIPLPPNRIRRFYRGGRLLGRFRGDPSAQDDDRPEDWVGSATATWTPPGAEPTTVGLSPVEVEGRRTTVAALLAQEPEAMVGPELVARAGPTTGVLVKLLDAGERLPVHCHPTRAAAARWLGSRFGKTEAWLILEVRDGDTATVWAGVREPVAPERFRGWIEARDTEAMLDALVEHEVRPGDALLVPAGTPHAIGAGIFLLELQEPTDFSVLAELRDVPVSPEDAALGLGWDRSIQFFDLAVDAVRQFPAVEADTTRMLDPDADPYFRLWRQSVTGTAALPFEPAYAVGVVLSGEGTLHGAHASITLRRGHAVAVPAAAAAVAHLEAPAGIELAWCLGPDPAALDRSPLPSVMAG